MVNRGVLLLVFAAGLSSLAAADKASEREATRALSPIASVVVLVDGGWNNTISGDETQASCKAFRLTGSDVMRYFQQARQVTEQAYSHDLAASRCYASGRLQFANASQATWKIDRERRGLLSFADGRSLYFHCPQCKTGAFHMR